MVISEHGRRFAAFMRSKKAGVKHLCQCFIGEVVTLCHKLNPVIMNEDEKKVQGEQAAAAPAAPAPVTTNRDKLRKRLAERYPDQSFDEDEDLYGRIDSDYDDYEGQLGQYRANEEKMVDLFNRDPRSARFLKEWADGNDPVVLMIRHYGSDIREILDDPDKIEEIAKANKEYVDRVAQEKDLEDQYEKNLEESLTLLEKVQKDKGLSDEDMEKVIAQLRDDANDVLMGRFTQDAIDRVTKALNYDQDVEAAGYEGEVRGKNQRIDEKLRKRNQGDGLARIQGSTGGGGAQPNREGFRNVIRGGSIWDTGEPEKRTSHRS